MRLYDLTFFCDKNTRPRFHTYKDKSMSWPITVRINDSYETHSTPVVTFHFESDEQFSFFVSTLNTEWKKLQEQVTEEDSDD